jgi:hypothetical protein
VGTVFDAAGSVVPGASVRIVNLRTALERRTITNATGEYRAPALPAGLYTMEASAPGFRTEVIRQATLAVNQTARVDFTLSPGAVTESVEVEAFLPLLNTETAALGQVIDTQRILEMPLNGRQFLELALLAPGVSSGNGSSLSIPSTSRGGPVPAFVPFSEG